MNKKSGVNKLGKPADQRNALIKSQVKDLLERGHIKTTKQRARAVAQRVDILIAFAVDKNGKSIQEYLTNEALTKKVLAFNTEARRSGFTSITAIKGRSGDNAELVLIELLTK
jgi:large subunit ribosomal protein L17